MTTFDNNKSTLKCIVIEIRSLKYFKYSFIIIIIKSLISDGDQFHQYQQNEQSLLIATELTEHNDNTTYDVGNTCPGLG
jgi:hypothetical protein